MTNEEAREIGATEGRAEAARFPGRRSSTVRERAQSFAQAFGHQHRELWESAEKKSPERKMFVDGFIEGYKSRV